MHDKPHTFLTVVDKTSVRQVLYGVAICVGSFEFTTGDVWLMLCIVAINISYNRT